MTEPLCAIQVNCPDAESAEAIATALLDARLVACANLRAPMTSLYRWKGAVERDQEIPLILKTRSALFERIAEAVTGLHPDETPCIVRFDLEASPGYRDWLLTETEAS